MEIDVQEAGKPIRLDDPPALRHEMHTLLQREVELDAAGVKCPIKMRSDTTCSVCPVRETDVNVPLSALCTVGCDQERVLTALAVAQL